MNLSPKHLQIMAGISHEIRNPVNAILGIAHLLREETDRKVQEELIGTLIQTSENLRELTSHILDFTKFQAGEVPRKPVPVDLRQQVPVILFGNSTMARAKGLDFVINIADDVPSRVLLDKVRGMQVMVNLVSNAIKFTQKGSITVEIKVLKNMGSQAILSFSVKDTGMGIPEEKQEVIFEPFRQAGRHINMKHGGTGLGLSIANMLIASAGGELKLKSRSGQGSEFFFDLLLDLPEEKIDQLPEENPAYREIAPENKKVLIVDDNEVNLLVTGKTLENHRIGFMIARNGAEALEKVQEEDFAAVLMDLHMPVMNGCEATQAIRKLEGKKYQDLPIIALSGSTGVLYEEEIIATGFTEFLSKPYKPQDLLDRIGALTSTGPQTIG